MLGGGVDDGYLIRPLSGVASSARMLGLAVLAPRALGRRLAGVSLAWEEHLDAVSELAAELRQRFGLPTLGAGGLSMGGLEALVFAGRHPRQVSAVWAANPIVDLAGWWEDLAAVDVGDGAGLSAQIEDEVGGAPIEASAAYRARSASEHLDGLTRIRVRIAWSPADTVIPRQATVHAHPLADGLRDRGGDVVEDVVTHLPTDPDQDPGRFAHEACDVRELMGWLAEAIVPARDEGDTP